MQSMWRSSQNCLCRCRTNGSAFQTLRKGLYCRSLKSLVDAGDIIGARGGVKRTEKGELSVNAAHVEILTKSLMPLPDKWHGLADIEKRYRQRCFPQQSQSW